jgi:hypothetical protein
MLVGVVVGNVIVHLLELSSSLKGLTLRMVTQTGFYVSSHPNGDAKTTVFQNCKWHQNKDGSKVITAEIFSPVKIVMSVLLTKNSTGYKIEDISTEVDWILDTSEREFFIHYTAKGIDNKGKFYTDVNGLDFTEKFLDPKKPREGNYAPVTKFIQIVDHNSSRAFTILVDSVQAGVSLAKGEVDLAFHRSHTGRDRMGAFEQGFEFERLTTNHKILYHDKNDNLLRKLQVEDDSPLLYAEAKTFSTSSKQLMENNDYKELKMPPTLRSLLDIRESGIMLRLYNMHDTEDVVIPDIKEFVKQKYNLERDFKLEERSLDYNQPIETILNQPYMWRNVTALKKAHAEEVQGNRIKLKPLTMITFKISLDK